MTDEHALRKEDLEGQLNCCGCGKRAPGPVRTCTVHPNLNCNCCQRCENRCKAGAEQL